MSEIFYILGGKSSYFSKKKIQPYRHEKAIALEVDSENLSVKRFVDYQTPLQFKADDDASVVFKSGYIDRDRGLLYACTTTEVLIYSLQDASQQTHISHPYMNDVHHVIPHKDNILVVSTGLDAVIELNHSGELINEWSVTDASTWDRFDKLLDYRKIEDTKPHACHPNFIQKVGDNFWVTRLQNRDSCDLHTNETRVNIAIEKPHDGVVYQSNAYYTTVDGHIVIASTSDNSISSIIDLKKIEKSSFAHGWCRGVKVVSSDVIIVGFSRIRPTMHMGNLNYLGIKTNLLTLKCMPTRIVAFDIVKKKVMWKLNLEDHDLNTVFSVL